jgi:hypothetical protein
VTRLQACLLASLALSVANCATAREVAFLAHPRIENAGLFKTQSVSEQRGPYLARPNAQLIVRNLATGAERVLVDRNVLDFSVSIDGTNLLVSIVDGYISKKSPGRCDVWRVDVASGTKTRLTNGPGWNCQPIELGDGSLAFLSNRDGWKSPKEVYRAFTIYHMNAQGGEQQRIWHAGIGGIFGLNLMPSGRILFASGEQQGHRVGRGNHWSIWSINPDGSDFAPEMSAIGLSPFVEPFDWPCIASDGSLVFTQYYDTRVYGVILAAPVWEAIPFGPLTMFGHPVFKRNPGYIDRNRHRFRLGFERRGLYSLTPQTSVHDAEIVSGTRPVGIYSHPWPIPGNKIYATWTGSKGDANSDVGVYEISLDAPISDYKQLTKVIDEPTRHEWMGKQLVSFAEIYGIDRPPMPTCPKTDLLPPGSPFALIGTSAVDINEWVLVPKSNPLANPLLVTTDESDPARDPYYVRILAFNPTMDRKPTARRRRRRPPCRSPVPFSRDRAPRRRPRAEWTRSGPWRSGPPAVRARRRLLRRLPGTSPRGWR